MTDKLDKVTCTFNNTIQTNHQPDATNFQFIILTFIYSSTCFGGSPAHHQELNDCSGSYIYKTGPTTNTARLSPRYEVKPEATTAVAELLMMGGRTPETCWAVNKRQDNKLKNCCIRLVIYLNCTMMHGLTNLKFYVSILAHPVCKMWIIH